MRARKRQLFERSQAGTLAARLGAPGRFLHVVAGARQAGRSTLVEQVLDRLDVPSVFISADEPTPLGSAPLLMPQGLTESLAGRFEVVHLPHWSYAEMGAAFGFSLEQYLYLGGHMGAAPHPSCLRTGAPGQPNHA